MKKPIFYIVLVIFMILPLDLNAQDRQQVSLESAFGLPSRNPCIVKKDAGFMKYCEYYNFDDDFNIFVGKDSEKNLFMAYLSPKGIISDLGYALSNEKKDAFLRDISTVKPLGAFKFKGNEKGLSLPFPETWEVYENALVITELEQINDGTYGTSSVRVFFPLPLTGVISSTERIAIGDNGDFINLLYIGSCTYLTINEIPEAGALDRLMVIGPRNGCYRSK